MSKRLDQEREQRLQPLRMERAKTVLSEMGFSVLEVNHTELNFLYKGHLIKFWPYSGWHTGKSIKDGRGLKPLLEQLSTHPSTTYAYPSLEARHA